MTWDDYRRQVKDDVRHQLDCYGEDGLFAAVDLGARTVDPGALVDDLWAYDDVTGNGSGSYTFDRSKAEANVAGVTWTAEFGDMLDEFGTDPSELFDEGPEAADVTVRCYLLDEACDAAAREWAPVHGFTVI